MLNGLGQFASENNFSQKKEVFDNSEVINHRVKHTLALIALS